MIRYFDWECLTCGRKHGGMVEIPHGTPVSEWPKTTTIVCPRCRIGTEHARALSAPASYVRAKIRTMAYGGEYDTMGHGRMTPLPEPPGNFERMSDFVDYTNSKEWKEATSKRKVEKEQNEAKRARARLMEAGADIDLRVDKLPGDHPFIRE